MDIRAYFGVKQSTTPKSSTTASKTASKQVTSKKKAVIESDSDDDVTTADKPKKKTPVISKTKRCILDSSDESANESSTKKLKTNASTASKRSFKHQLSDSSSEESSPVAKKRLGRQSTLQNVKVTSKFFKQTSAAAMFGDEPIKRNDSKLKEIQAKLKKKSKEAKQDIPQIPDDDADFEATLAQLDEIGVDGWILSPSKEESRETKSTKIESLSKPDQKKLKHKADLMKSVTSKNLDKKSNFKSEDASSNSNTDSGFDSHDSQNFDETESRATASKKLGTVNEIIESARRVSPRKSAKLASPSVSLKRVEESFSEPKVLVPKLASREKTSVVKETGIRITNESICTSDVIEKRIVTSTEEHELWVEKYKPTSTKKIIGQQGDKSNVKKLTDWLNNWCKNNSGKKKAAFVPNGWNKDPTGACFKAALLSGPPGVGKTTSVNLVCKELGFDTVEFNASDTRSKKLLQDEVSRLLSNTSLIPFFSNEESREAVTKRHVLVMDEVDGMAGNEDRGGVQELIQLIKTTKVPIICMCNDRNHPKIRSLVNYCFDLRFSRPRVEQIKGYMRSVCFKEKLNISNEALTDIITSANNDVRLVLNHLSMLVADKSDLEASKKHIKLGAWDVLRKVFTKEDHKNMSIHDKCDLFFFDYNIAPLFVQENYLNVKPLNVDVNDKCRKMELFAEAADCISRGDLVDKNIRTNMAWSLLPTQAIFASYAPGEILEGYCGGQINFPSWLGKNSRRNKIDRLLQEIQIHTRLKLSASKESINLDYASQLRDQIVEPLVREGADGVKLALERLHEYQLLKEDLDSLQEICQWPNSKNQLSSLDSKIKAAFTRAYNKNPPVRPYSLIAPIKKAASNATEDLGMEDDENEEERSDDETDAMIIVKKKLPSAKKTDTPTPSSSKKVSSNKKNTGKRGGKR